MPEESFTPPRFIWRRNNSQRKRPLFLKQRSMLTETVGAHKLPVEALWDILKDRLKVSEPLRCQLQGPCVGQPWQKFHKMHFCPLWQCVSDISIITIYKLNMGCWGIKRWCLRLKTHVAQYKRHAALMWQQPVYILIRFFSTTLRHDTNIVQAFFSKPQVAAGLPLTAHCQVQEMGFFYRDGANLG